MSNLIRYIIQEDPEKQMKKNDLDYTKYSTSWASIQKQSQEDKYKGYKFSSKNLLENSFNSLTSNKSSQSKDDGSFMSGISNIFNNIKSDTRSSSNTSLPQSIAKTAAEESSKISTVLSPKSIGNDAASYKIAQDAKGNIANKPSVTFDDIYFSTLDADGKVIYKGTDLHEGGLSNRKNDLGGLTNYGVRQDALNEYNNWNAPLKKGTNFPTDVKDLTAKQAKQIMDEMYYQRYNINKLQNLKIARNTFDAEVNQGTDAGKLLAGAMNKHFGYKDEKSPGFFYKNISINKNLADAVNNLSEEDTIKVNDILTENRMEKYFRSVDKKPIKNVNNINGWYNRAKSYYSNPQKFEKLYKLRVDDYIKNKYPQYYNGK